MKESLSLQISQMLKGRLGNSIDNSVQVNLTILHFPHIPLELRPRLEISSVFLYCVTSFSPLVYTSYVIL